MCGFSFVSTSYIGNSRNFSFDIYLELLISVTVNICFRLVSKMNTTLMPIFWFSQTAELTNDLADTVKMVLILPSAGQYTGYGLLGLGLLLGAIGIFITYRLGWQDSEEEHLLNQNEL